MRLLIKNKIGKKEHSQIGDSRWLSDRDKADLYFLGYGKKTWEYSGSLVEDNALLSGPALS